MQRGRRRRPAGHGPFTRAAVEHGLDVFPRVHHVIRRVVAEFHVTTPRVEVGRVRLHVPSTGAGPVRMEYELVGREEQAARGASDALGPGRVVPRRQKRAAAAPRALVVHRKGEVVGQPRRRVVAQKRVAQPFRLASGDHSAPARRHRHGAGPAQHLQLHRGALHARDAQRHATVVYLVVAEPVQQRVADLGQTQPLLVVHL